MLLCRQREGSQGSEEPEYWDKFAKLATDPHYEEHKAQGPLVVRRPTLDPTCCNSTSTLVV
jgi:hypothetical protein